MSSKIDKQVLKGPDAFVSASDKAFAWVENNLKIIAVVIGGALVVAIAFIGYSFYSAGLEAKATEALYRPEAELKKAEENLRVDQAKPLDAMLKDAKAAKPAAPAAPDYAKDFAPSVEKIKAEIKNHAGTRAALVSALNLTSFLVQQKQFEQAMEVIELPRFRPSDDDMLGGFFNMHRGLVYMENQKLDKALESYGEVVKSSSLKYFHPEALLKQGVAFELKGDLLKARENYEKVSREFPTTEASKTAQQYLRLLESKSQQG